MNKRRRFKAKRRRAIWREAHIICSMNAYSLRRFLALNGGIEFFNR